MKKPKIISIILSLVFVSFAGNAAAQIVSAEIGVNGLTCSQCSRSVEMELRKLPFVNKVAMNLEQTQGEIYFKKDKKINLDELAQAVRNAGFSTRFVNIQFDFSGLNPGSDCFIYQGKAFYFLKPLSKGHPDEMKFQIIGDGFLPKKELKNYTLNAAGTCVASEKYYLRTLGS